MKRMRAFHAFHAAVQRALKLAAIVTTIYGVPAIADTSITGSNNEVSVALGAHHLRYHELDVYHQTGGAYLDSESGTQPAVRTTLSRQGPLFGIRDMYSAFELTAAAGHSNYGGYSILVASPHGIGAPLRQNKFGVTVDAGFKLGRSFELFRPGSFQVTPYLDYGYHRWARDSIETYSNHFAGVGLLLQYAASTRLVVTADLAVDRMLLAQVHTAHGVDETLSPGMVRTLRLAGDYRITPHLHATATWQARSFNYGQSATVSGWYSGMYGDWYEPTSKTIEQLLMVGIAYAF